MASVINELDSELSLEKMEEAYTYIIQNGYCRKTPIMKHVQHCFNGQLGTNTNLYFKMENMQISGCFKMRGVTNQLRHVVSGQRMKPDGQRLVTFSGGNYGKAFSMVTNRLNLSNTVVMPDSVPKDRIGIIKSNGSAVEMVPMSQITNKLEEFKSQGMIYLDPFDDYDLIAAYGSIAFEILDDIPEPDIVLVPCGGGGLLSGVAAGFRRRGCRNTKIYGVEPYTANTMSESFKQKRPISLPNVHSVATGLCSPYAGRITYKVCEKFVDDILLVSDEEIIQSVKLLHSIGLNIEPSGAAGLATLLSGRMPADLVNKNVVVLISGCNITLSQLSEILNKYE